MARRTKQVSGYNPRFVVWWMQGIKAPTTVTFPTRRIATRIRQDLYNLRKAMHLEGHYAATLTDRGEIILRPLDPYCTDIEDPHTLTIQPVNFDINQSLDEANIHAPEVGEDIHTEHEPESESKPETQEHINYANLMRPDDE